MSKQNPRHETPWNAEEVKSLLELQAQGLSYSQIGKAIGRGRDMVAGKLFRVRAAAKRKVRAYG